MPATGVAGRPDDLAEELAQQVAVVGDSPLDVACALAHGVTAWRGSNAYADWFETHGGGDSSPEGRATHPVRLTRRFGSHR